MAAPLPSAPSRSSRHWILYGILVVLLFIMALIAKAAIVILAYRLLYPLPLLGGMARSLEVVEFLNILVFAIVGMGLGLLTRMLSPQTGDRVGYGLLIVLLPLLFFSGTIFHYQLWVNGVSSANELTYGAARAMTDRWLEQTINGSGVWGYYRFTAQYTTLPLEPDQVQVASLGMERVGKLLGEITGQSGPEMIGVLALNTWFLRLFYLGIACFSGLTHFQDGRAHAYQAKLRKNRQGSPNSSVPSSDGSGNPQPARSQAELDRARREKDRQDWQRQSQRDRVRDQQRLQPPQRRPNPRPAQQPHSDPKNS